MSKPAKKRPAPPPPKPEGPLGEDVVHVPKGTSRLRFLLTLALTIFVLLIFTVGDQLVGTVGRRAGSDVYMTWEHPTQGTQRLGWQEFLEVKRRLDDFFRVQGGRMSRDEGSDEAIANLIITDRIAREAGIEIANAELARVIREGEPGVLPPFLNSANYKARLSGAGVAAPAFEEMLRKRLRVMRYQLLLALSMAQPEPAAIEALWKEDHQQYAFDLASVAREDLRAAAEAELPDAAGLEAWYVELEEFEKRRLFNDQYLPERTAVALLSWPADGDAPAPLLERFPRPEGTDLAVLARGYYDRNLQRRYRRPEPSGQEDEPGEEPGEEPDQEPDEPAPPDDEAAVEDADADAEPAAEARSLEDELHLPYEEVAERARVEAEVHAALTDLLGDLRGRLAAGEELDLASLAFELGLEYQGDGVPRSREQWIELADPFLADGVAFTGVDGFPRTAIVGSAHLWLPRVVERLPSEAPPFADVEQGVREAWLEQRASELALEKVTELRDALLAADAPDEGAEPDEGEQAQAAGAEPEPVEGQAFTERAAELGLEVTHQDWFDPSRPSELPSDEVPAAEAFLRSTWFPGAALYALEEGQLSEPRVGTDGERVWLVRAAGRRDPPAIDLRPAEYEGLRQRAQMEAITALFERMTNPEELSGRYGLRFPGRVEPDQDEPGT